LNYHRKKALALVVRNPALLIIQAARELVETSRYREAKRVAAEAAAAAEATRLEAESVAAEAAAAAEATRLEAESVAAEAAADGGPLRGGKLRAARECLKTLADAAGKKLAAGLTPVVLNDLVAGGHAGIDGGIEMETFINFVHTNSGRLPKYPSGLSNTPAAVLGGRSMKDDTSPDVQDAFLILASAATKKIWTHVPEWSGLVNVALGASVRDLRATTTSQLWHADCGCLSSVTFIFLMERHDGPRTALITGSHIGGDAAVDWKLVEWGAGKGAGATCIMINQPLHLGAAVCDTDDGKSAMYVAVTPLGRAKLVNAVGHVYVVEKLSKATAGSRYESGDKPVVFKPQGHNASRALKE